MERGGDETESDEVCEWSGGVNITVNIVRWRAATTAARSARVPRPTARHVYRSVHMAFSLPYHCEPMALALVSLWPAFTIALRTRW